MTENRDLNPVSATADMEGNASVHGQNPPRPRARLPYFDNAKYLLITLVVVGHILKFGASDQFSEAKGLAVWIYSFHMPAFIFLSGIFLSRERMTVRKTLTQATTYMALGLLAQLLRKAVPFIIGQPVDIDFLVWAGLPWFMLALGAYYLLAGLLKWCNFVVVGILSVVLALAAGNNASIGDTLCLSRIIVFFPFFWLGHALHPKQILDFFADWRVRVACALLLVAGLAFCVTRAEELFVWRDLFLGNHCYAASPIEGCTWVNRLIGYGAALLMTFGFLGVVPRGQVPFMSCLGAHTLQVYLLHYEVIEVLNLRGILASALSYGARGWLVVVATGIALTLVLALPKISLPSAKELLGIGESESKEG